MRLALIPLLAAAAVGGLAGGALADPAPISIDAPDSVEAVDATGADVSYHVKSRVDLDVTCSPAGGPGQDFTATAHFPLGTSTISCTDGTNTEGETVEVRDTTGPTISVPGPISQSTTSPGGTAVSYSVSATDAVDGAVTVSCSPASGDNFPIGTTTVGCSAADSRSNSSNASFTVTVTLIDTEAPTFTSVPASQTVEATSGSGAAVAWEAPSATDNSGITPTISCNPSSGSVFPLGTATVTCRATDGAGNFTDSSFSVTVQDTTPPVLNLPGGVSVETESPAGAAVSYAATASDAVAGAIAPSCNPASGAMFPVGMSTVTCSADDGHGHSVNGSFSVSVTLVDRTAPVLAGVPASRAVEANGPGGSVANYTTPTATDNLDGPIAAVTCAPPSGTLFPLGVTGVTCSATDSHGNSGTASFQISVVDTVPPSLVVPGATSVYATTPDGVPDSDAAINGFIRAARAADLVDPNPTITHDIHSFVPVGIHTVTFIARDASGNTTARQVSLTVLPMPPAGTPPLPVPPAATAPQNVRNLKAEAGDGRVRLSWELPAGTDHVVVTRALSAGGDAQTVYTGKAESFVDRTVVNGLEYRYLVVSFDARGNGSAGVAAVALPKATLLRSPKDGAKLKKPPKLVWVRNGEATYYNVQLFRGDTKILSAWPNAAALPLKRAWKYQGRKYTLTPGAYRWYVWPGFGARSDVDYGELMGFSTFQIVR